MTPEDVDKIARGRVWSGEDAKGSGSWTSSAASTTRSSRRRRAPSSAKDYQVRYVEKEQTWKQKLVRGMFAEATAGAADEVRTSRTAAPYLAAARLWARQQAELELAAQAQGVLAYSFVPVE